VRIYRGLALDLPPEGRTVLRVAQVGEDAQLACVLGFVAFDAFAIRQDVAERLAAGLRARAHAGASFALPVELAAQAGLTRAELETVLAKLGYRGRGSEAGSSANDTVYAFDQRRRRHEQRRRDAHQAASAHSPFAALAALKAGS
jgi:hypothetical protein